MSSAKKNWRIYSEKSFNVESSGGKERSNSVELNVLRERFGKNYGRKFEKSLKEGESQKGREAPGAGSGVKMARVSSRSNILRRFRSLEDFSGSGRRCLAKEREMTRKLREIHEMIEKMQENLPEEKKEKRKEETKENRKYTTTQDLKFKTSCRLKRKFVPVQFTSSFITELGTKRKYYTEIIIFKDRFVPDLNKNLLPKEELFLVGSSDSC